MFEQMPGSRRRREYRERVAREEAEAKAKAEAEAQTKAQKDGTIHVDTNQKGGSAGTSFQAASQVEVEGSPRICPFTPINRPRASKPFTIPPDAEVIEISSSPSPPAESSQANQSVAQPKETPQKPKLPEPPQTPTTEPLVNRQPHTSFKAIKIHTAKCDVCNNHNKATLHRCVECGWQICSPCWNIRGNGDHGPTRTFNGPIFRRSGKGDPQGNDANANDEVDSEADTIILSSDDGRLGGKDPGPGPFHTYGMAKDTVDKDGASTETYSDGSDSIPLMQKRNERLQRGNKVAEDRNDEVADNNKNRDPSVGAASNVRSGFRDLTPISTQSMQNLIAAAELILGDEPSEVPTLPSATATQEQVHLERSSRQPLFVPMDDQIMAMHRRNELIINQPILAERSTQQMYNMSRSQQPEASYRPPTRGSSQTVCSSTSKSSVGPAGATKPFRLPPMGEFKTGGPRPKKRKCDPNTESSAPEATSSPASAQNNVQNREINVPFRPASRATRGRAWEL